MLAPKTRHLTDPNDCSKCGRVECESNPKPLPNLSIQVLAPGFSLSGTALLRERRSQLPCSTVLTWVRETDLEPASWQGFSLTPSTLLEAGRTPTALSRIVLPEQWYQNSNLP